ncbi:ABC transporter substrate-binding protein [Corynebacterium cystitidis]|uniref:ABC transporter substrate-binding protein n=1 Tax=Corynebacterium cystitidis TaxID=35757 RepID=UPI00211F4097|nr:ABC transporter substrate-binding protein [Corynebacterium cystitidis]
MYPVLKKIAVTAVVSSVLFTSACFAEDSAGNKAADGNRITIGGMSSPDSNLSPLSDDALMLSQWAVGETLTRLDEDNVAQPLLAQSWEQIDETTWRFTIRDGVKFHDGTELTAQQTADALNFANTASPQPRVLDSVDYTFSADGADVIVESAQPDPLVAEMLSSPNLMILAEAAYGDGTIDPIGHGTGPFELVAVDGNSSATMEAFDDYWGEPAALAGFEAQFIPDPTARSAAVRTGTDVVTSLSPTTLTEVDPERIVEVATARTTTLHFNTDSGVFSDPAMRTAAAEAIDTSTLVDTVFEGYGDVAEGFFGPALPWAQPLRSEDDYTKELEKRVPAASPEDVKGTEITLATYTDRAELPELAVRIEQYLEDAGFVVTQEVRDYDYIEQDAFDGKFDLFILSRNTILDSGDPVAFLTSDYSCDGSYNLSLFCDPKVDQLIDTAASTEVGPDRQKAIMDVEAALLSRLASLPLVNEVGLNGESGRVNGVVHDPLSRRLITESTTTTESNQ